MKKTLNMTKKALHNALKRFMHTKTPSVTIQGNITAMMYRNDVIRSVLLLGMMLARDYALCHAVRSTLVMLKANNVRIQMICKNPNFNPIDHLLDLLKRRVRAQSLQLNLKELTRVIHHIYAAITVY